MTRDNKQDKEPDLNTLAGGDALESPHVVGVFDQKNQTLGQQMRAIEDCILLETAPLDVLGDHGLEREKITGVRYPDGRKIYSHEGQVFVEIAAPAIKAQKSGEGAYVLNATIKFKKVETE